MGSRPRWPRAAFLRTDESRKLVTGIERRTRANSEPHSRGRRSWCTISLAAARVRMRHEQEYFKNKFDRFSNEFRRRKFISMIFSNRTSRAIAASLLQPTITIREAS